MGLLVMAVFWVSVGFAFFVLNAKTALMFIGLWVVGLAAGIGLHLSPFIFLGYQALLAACLCVVLKMEWS